MSATAMLGYILDEVFVQHRAPSGHPERPARAEAVRDALNAAGLAARGSHIATRAATDEELARVHTPIGLDLGGKAPAEVALSILSEIVAVYSGKRA